MRRLRGCAVLGLVGVLTLSWVGQSFAEQPRAVSARPAVGEVSSEWNTDVRPPLLPGKPRDCANPPDHADILRALPLVPRDIPGLYHFPRHDFEFAVECLVDRVDAPRFYPLVGPAQLHHCHYKCTVSFTETIIDSGYPLTFVWEHRRKETVYIDRDHLHLVDVTSAATK